MGMAKEVFFPERFLLIRALADERDNEILWLASLLWGFRFSSDVVHPASYEWKGELKANIYVPTHDC